MTDITTDFDNGIVFAAIQAADALEKAIGSFNALVTETVISPSERAALARLLLRVRERQNAEAFSA